MGFIGMSLVIILYLILVLALIYCYIELCLKFFPPIIDTETEKKRINIIKQKDKDFNEDDIKKQAENLFYELINNKESEKIINKVQKKAPFFMFIMNSHKTNIDIIENVRDVKFIPYNIKLKKDKDKSPIKIIKGTYAILCYDYDKNILIKHDMPVLIKEKNGECFIFKYYMIDNNTYEEDLFIHEYWQKKIKVNNPYTKIDTFMKSIEKQILEYQNCFISKDKNRLKKIASKEMAEQAIEKIELHQAKNRTHMFDDNMIKDLYFVNYDSTEHGEYVSVYTNHDLYEYIRNDETFEPIKGLGQNKNKATKIFKTVLYRDFKPVYEKECVKCHNKIKSNFVECPYCKTMIKEDVNPWIITKHERVSTEEEIEKIQKIIDKENGVKKNKK